MSSTPEETRRSSWGVCVAIGMMLAVHVYLAVDCARRLTVTHDEFWHLPVGLLNLKTGRFDYDNLNPPLTRMWGALPLCFTSASSGQIEAAKNAEDFGNAFLAANHDNYFRLFWFGRLPNIAFSFGIGLILAFWSRRWRGNAAALVTVGLWSCSATALANASLITPDMGVAFFFVAVFYDLWKFSREPNWKRAISLGVLLGLAQLTKFTAVLLYPLCLVGWCVLSIGQQDPQETAVPKCLKTRIAQAVSAFVLSLVILNLGYLFQGSFSSLKSYEFASRTLHRTQQWAGPLQAVPVPLPRDYVAGFDRQRQIMEGQHPVYLDGEWRIDGFLDYYEMALFYKLSHAEQLFCLLAVFFLVFPGDEKRDLRLQAFLLLPVACMLFVASTSRMQLGLRYILPAIPFLFLFAGQSAAWLRWSTYPVRTVLLGLTIAAIPWGLRFHPHYLAYFNELAGGPEAGRAHLLDSNLDWGQDLRGLKPYLDSQGVSEIGLAYFGTVPPAALAIQYHFPPSHVPEPGWYAISVNYVQGRPHVLWDKDGKARPVDLDEFAYFRYFEPKARIGYSIYVYHLTEQDVMRWHNAVRQLRRMR